MKIKRIIMGSKGATMTFLVSIWIGLIAVSVLMNMGTGVPGMPPAAQNVSSVWFDQIYPILKDPIGSFPTLLRNAFSSPATAALVGIMIGGTVGLPLLANFLTGGGFSLLFAIPMVFIFSIVNIFVLPTMAIINGTLGLPPEFQFIYVLFLSSLTTVTIISFTTGRQ